MADPLPPSPDDTRMPRWVKISFLAGGAFVITVAILMLLGHGPGQHMQHLATPTQSAPQ